MINANANSIWRRHFSAGAAFSFGNCLLFDRVNDRGLGSNVNFLNGETKLSVLFWFKKSDTNVGDVCSKYPSTNDKGFRIRWAAADKLQVLVPKNSGAFSLWTMDNSVVSATSWHLAGVFIDLDAGTVEIYIDTVLQAVTNTGGTAGTSFGTYTTYPITVGVYRNDANAFSNYYGGYLDEMVLYAGSADTTLQNDMWAGGTGGAPRAGHSIYWKFNEDNPATTAVDEDGADDLTLQNFNYNASSGFLPHT